MTLDGATAVAKGPKGTITKDLPPECEIKVEGDVVNVARPSDSRHHRRMHGQNLYPLGLCQPLHGPPPTDDGLRIDRQLNADEPRRSCPTEDQRQGIDV